MSAVIGVIVGSLLNRASEAAPRFTSRASAGRAPSPSRLSLVIEILMAVLFAYVWARFGLSFNLLLFACLCSFFVLIALIDLRYHLVPNMLVYPASALTLLASFMLPEMDPRATLLGGALGLILFALAALIKPGGLGGGDVKLATLIGLIFGFPHAIWALMVGIFAGGITSIVLILSRRRSPHSQIPYAPFLCLGALIALLYDPISAIFGL